MDRLTNILKQRLEAGQSAQDEHPSADTLTAFVEHSLRTVERTAVLSHLAVCPTCRDSVALASAERADEKAQAAAAPRRFQLQFPAAMRWASVAAAFAVAIGVGILSYEHETPSGRILTGPATAQQTAVRNESVPTTNQQKSKLNAAEATKPKLGLNGATDAPKLTSRRASLEHKKQAPASSRTEAKELNALPLEQNQPKSAYDFASGTDTSSSSAMSAKVLPPPAPAPAANSQTETVAVQSEAPAMANTAPSASAAPESQSRTAVVGAIAGAQLQQSPKSFNGIAVGGPVRKKISRSNEIVRWTISSAGKLVRWAQNGVSNVIEPAPGLAVRAVAAKGIEVWAGGVQPDPSARQWQQRPALFHSSDAGETWTKIDGPWTAPIERLNLGSENALTVSAQDGTWSTSDGGKNWVRQ